MTYVRSYCDIRIIIVVALKPTAILYLPILSYQLSIIIIYYIQIHQVYPMNSCQFANIFPIHDIQYVINRFVVAM